MPAPTPHPVEHCTLNNGLRVSLRSTPHLKRCAASLRVAAGSHDVPLAWPGLAHFLEHLFFLGTERFPAEDGLMRYVQRHGGQLNATTRERTTDFFFEAPTGAFAGGLERLCDMLTAPRMAVDEQLREREVLHAEFIAWSRDATAQRQFRLYQGLSAAHPLRAFHAGNRYTLPIPSAHFQRALRGFYERFYQAGQMTLSITGPQPIAELKTLAKAFGLQLAKGRQVARAAPPKLLGEPSANCPMQQDRQLDLLFACEALPAPALAAIEFLGTWLSDPQPGGLLAALRAGGWLEQLRFKPLYHFAGQALLHVEFQLSAAGADAPEAVSGLFFDWLDFFRQANWQGLLTEYALLQQRRMAVGSALELARHDSEHFGSETGHAFPAPAVAALHRLLECLVPKLCLSPQSPSKVAPDSAWQLPAPNPFLRPAPATPATRSCPAAMVFSTALPAMRDTGAVYLRWQLRSSVRNSLWQVLEQSLRNLTDRARQAGVELSFSRCAGFWQLKCIGIQEPIAAIIEQAIGCLIAPPAEHWQAYAQPAREAPLLPIRQLLKELPEHWLGQYEAVAECPDPAQALEDLSQLWAGAQWQGLATGFSALNRARLQAALTHLPGRPGTADPCPALAQRRWSQLPLNATEQALLLFCPAPGRNLAEQAIWRLLAHLCQGPFYQRLRVELQLGYAVFSGFRQVHGQAGLLFGVQSPHATHKEIVEHIRTFMGELPRHLAELAPATLDAQRQTLAAQFDEPAMANAEIAEWAWQSQLAHSSGSLAQLQQAILAVGSDALQQAAQQLEQAHHGWLALANGTQPDDRWHVAKRSLPGLQ
ncbi:pyrroloquinoline quinone biosynthesis protein PqqF [Pseudomonas sp. LS1212]|uniref:pyrroloquinoline quinone biosynthesis protein PqqF n=1 Tax=Pseudomonas sp. LS1212 TaxID=2972478 RepID=UPI00215BFA04|nr:pyrroloquinoline quinone biosynthesis protein PqqF [Pseudomonas sp. LS1212]UVJ46660.1 pyrroloquinoline quinone biosynthesis protein PqqF [Pseudomonas sp. LS1212]